MAQDQVRSMVGQELGSYRILSLLGVGGMGEVYLAEDRKLDRRVALKFLPEEMQRDENARKRFLREAKSAAALDHPFICKIYETGDADDRFFISMEYVEGQTLKDRLAKGSLLLKQALQTAVQIAGAVEKAHGKGIVHRDLKPSNVMLTPEGHVKVMDFGLAKRLLSTEDANSHEPTITADLTKTGTTLGTLAYMSPEQLRGQAVDGRSDVFSFGVMLYEMLTGVHPFLKPERMETASAILRDNPSPLSHYIPDLPKPFEHTMQKMLAKQAGDRYASSREVRLDLDQLTGSVPFIRIGDRSSDSAARGRTQTPETLVAEVEMGASELPTFLRRILKPHIAVPAVTLILLFVLGAAWFFNRQAKIRWAREVALPEVERLIEANWRDFTDSYKLAEQAEVYIPDDPELAALFSKSSFNINIKTEPAGASIYMKEYKSPDSEWEYLGISPIQNIRLPIGIFRWRIEKEGFETVLAAASTWDLDLAERNLLIPNNLSRVLDETGSIPQGMVRVPGAQTPLGKLEDFFIDRHEVTNRQYKAFLDNRGYRKPEYWEHELVKEGRVLTWEEAISEFIDQTARPGPAIWQAGDYPDGEGDYPVSGISWYEAAAYAAFVGRSLPTGQHWGLARGEYTSLIKYPTQGGFAVFAPFSNFAGKGPVPVRSLPGITSHGAYDMAGNVREWCWNETSVGRLMRGGAWNDNTYRFTELAGAPPFNRSSRNGFRCAFYPDPDKIPEAAFAIATLGEARDFYKEQPVTEAIFQVYKEQFSYDKTDLHARLESRYESAEDWTSERITFDAAYGNERITASLFLPKNTPPPYQTVIYVPGSASVFHPSSENLHNYYEFPVFLSFSVKNGRAVLYPVYKGTFERRDDALIPIYNGADSHSYTEYLIQVVKDLRRSIDFLETRQDIDSERLAYYGMSWGATLGVIISAVEERFKTTILLGGGLTGHGRPEANQINYITRAKTPTLVLKGKYDTLLPL